MLYDSLEPSIRYHIDNFLAEYTVLTGPIVTRNVNCKRGELGTPVGVESIIKTPNGELKQNLNITSRSAPCLKTRLSESALAMFTNSSSQAGLQRGVSLMWHAIGLTIEHEVIRSHAGNASPPGKPLHQNISGMRYTNEVSMVPDGWSIEA